MSRQNSTSKGKKRDSGEGEGEGVAPTRAERWRGYLREVVFLGLLVLSVLSARSSLADHYYVPTGSMLPTVEEGDHLVVNKLAYGVRVPFTELYLWRFEGPRRGDVVVLESPSDGIILLKRVVALPGDRVRVQGGHLFIDGREMPVEADGDTLLEDLDGVRHQIRLVPDGGEGLSRLTHGADANGEAVVPEGTYLVMGDNRGQSRDGRAFGWVRREAILGQGLAIYWRSGFHWLPL
ncbi:MAG: signal peptidase I [Deltaproteobacteria bacterium]|nr:signal peptidase I [Deltaproteobacteria bacterium]